MYKKRFAFIIVALVAMSISTTSIADTPAVMSFQGRLTDSGDSLLNGNYSILFTIYDDPVASAPANIKWQETHSSVSVTDGLFNVLLGAGVPSVPLTDGVFDGSARYLGIKIGGDPEISPRTQIATSAYSHRISTVDGARGGEVSDSITVITSNGLPGIAIIARLDTMAIRFYEPVSVIPPLERFVPQPLLLELNDEALLMFSNSGAAQPQDTSVRITSDGRIDAASTIAVGLETHATGISSAAFGAQDTASGPFSIVAGGQNNNARGNFSFAAGRNAKANHDAAFVWADGALSDYSSTNPNTFNIRAGNGLILSSEAGATKNIAIGEHYRDNGIVAWARVEEDGTSGPSQFGITFIGRDSNGIYTVVVDALALNANHLVPVACVEVDAPPTNPLAARLIYVDQINLNMFKIYITDGAYTLTDNAFVFMVTAR